MNREERRKYIFAQLGSLPNAIQYVEVTKYIENLEQQCKKQQQVIDKVIKYVEDYTSGERIITYEQYKSELLDILKGGD